MILFDNRKLKGRIVEKYGSQAKFAEEIDISVQALSKKLSGQTNISRAEIIEWSYLLDIKPEEIVSYFFVPKV